MNEKELKRQREYRARTGNKATKDYERTKKGKLMRTYRNMKSRILGIAPKGRKRYTGLDILSKDSFYEWSIKRDDFNSLYIQWVENDYCRKLSPSIDRIDSSLGYVLGNIRWLTLSENSKIGSRNKS